MVELRKTLLYPCSIGTIAPVCPAQAPGPGPTNGQCWRQRRHHSASRDIGRTGAKTGPRPRLRGWLRWLGCSANQGLMFSTVDIDVYWYFHILFTIFHLWVLYCWRDIGTSIHRDFYWWVVLSASGCLFRSEHCEYKCNIWVKIGELYRGPRTAPWRDVLTRLVRSVSSGDVDLAGEVTPRTKDRTKGGSKLRLRC